MSFSQEDLETAIQYFLGINTFRHKQLEVIKHVFDKRDVICTFPTGYGKSICYLSPALVKNGPILVISPLVSLIQDQVSKLNQVQRIAFNLSSSCEAVDVSDEDYVFDASNLPAIMSSPTILFCTPEKIASSFFQQKMKWLHEQYAFEYFVVDEAHMIEQGFEFRNSWLKLNFLRAEFPQVQILCFSATCNEFGRLTLKKTLGLKNVVHISEPDEKENLTLTVHYVTKKSKECTCSNQKCTWRQDFACPGVHQSLVEDITRYAAGETLLVTNSRKECEELANDLMLKMPSKKIAIYHGQLEDDTRAKIQNEFVNGETDILCCTMASFGTGVNMVRLIKVVIFGIPLSFFSFVQTCGRGGRAKQEYEVDVFVKESDLVKQRAVLQAETKKVHAMREYSEYMRGAFEKMVKIVKHAEARSDCLVSLMSLMLQEKRQNLAVKYCELASFKRVNHSIASVNKARWSSRAKKWYLEDNAYDAKFAQYGATKPVALLACKKCSNCLYKY